MGKIAGKQASVIFSFMLFMSSSFCLQRAQAEDSKEEEAAGSEEKEVKVEAFDYPGVDPEKGGIAPLLEKARKSKINVVTWPGFQLLPEGQGSRVFVQILKGSKISAIDQPVKVEKPPFKAAPNTLVYKFPESVVLLKNNYNPLISKYFNTPVSKTRMKKHKKRVYMIIELKLSVIPLREKFILYKDDLYFFFIEFEPGNYLPEKSKEED